VTVETAVALPALVLVLAVAIWGVSATAAEVACVDAARAGARAAARGERPEAVRAAVLRAAPAGAAVGIVRGPALTRVTVRVTVRPPIPRLMPPLKLSAHAAAATEGADGEQPQQ
jgi:hypothetical protein